MDSQKEQSGIFRTRVHAKVNLALGVGSVDGTSGLHPICSWMHAIDLCDEVVICKVPEEQESQYILGWAECAGADQPVEWAIEEDLGVCAHKLIEEHVDRRLPVKLGISKSIPAGGGLGGGSADAAGVFVGINKLFDLKIDHQTLVGLAMKLGSDIPFFLDPGHAIPRSAVVQGFGDQITRLSSNHVGTPITLIMPVFGCHTGKVYQAFDSCVETGRVLDRDRVHEIASQGAIDSSVLFNHLAGPAAMVAPELDVIRDVLHKSTNQVVHVSGSGSTLFIIGEIDPGLIKGICPSCTVVQTQLC